MKDLPEPGSEPDAIGSVSSPKRYTPTSTFRLVAILFLLAGVWLAGEMLRQQTRLSVLLFVVPAGIALWLLIGALSWLEYDGQNLHYHRPIFSTLTIPVRDIVRVEMGGRRTKALILEYRLPAEEADPASPTRFLNLIPLRDQDSLLSLLQAQIQQS
ncbi:MAG: hypothetical protein D6775_00090 [Caldilineae bacterium]|nr:MAG: hypothetical protein D6775_00090 [Caldilineae bacterium]